MAGERSGARAGRLVSNLITHCLTYKLKMPLLRSYVAYVERLAIAHRQKIPKSIRYTVDYMLFNKLEVFINNQ